MMLPAVTSPSVFTGDHGNVGFHWTLQIVDPKIKMKKKQKTNKTGEVMDICTHFTDFPGSF